MKGYYFAARGGTKYCFWLNRKTTYLEFGGLFEPKVKKVPWVIFGAWRARSRTEIGFEVEAMDRPGEPKKTWNLYVRTYVRTYVRGSISGRSMRSRNFRFSPIDRDFGIDELINFWAGSAVTDRAQIYKRVFFMQFNRFLRNTIIFSSRVHLEKSGETVGEWSEFSKFPEKHGFDYPTKKSDNRIFSENR